MTENPFNGMKLRSFYDKSADKWWFSAVDVCAMLTGKDYDGARKYWNNQKHNLYKVRNQLVVNYDQLKLPAANGRYYYTDVFDAVSVAYLIQIIPYAKAHPYKMWLAHMIVTNTNLEELLAEAGAEDAKEIRKHKDSTDAPYELQTVTREDIPLQ